MFSSYSIQHKFHILKNEKQFPKTQLFWLLNLKSGPKLRKKEFPRKKNWAELFSPHTIQHKFPIFKIHNNFWKSQLFWVLNMKSGPKFKEKELEKFWRKQLFRRNELEILGLGKIFSNFVPKISIVENIFCGTDWHKVSTIRQKFCFSNNYNLTFILLF